MRNTVNAACFILALCASLVVLAGCSTPCESVCASFNECSISERDHDVDCGTFCGRVDQFQETATQTGADACVAEFDAYIGCWETNLSDICNAENTACDASVQAWIDCMAKFCAVEANTHDQACVPQSEGPAVPALRGF